MVHGSRKDAKGNPSYIVRTIPLQVELAKSQGFEVLAAPPVETVEPKKAKVANKATETAATKATEPAAKKGKATPKAAAKTTVKKTTK